MLAGSRRLLMSSGRYRAVSQSTVDSAADEDDCVGRDYDDVDGDDGAGGGDGRSSSYESFGVGACQLVLRDAGDAAATASTCPHPRGTGKCDDTARWRIHEGGRWGDHTPSPLPSPRPVYSYKICVYVQS